MPGAFEIPLAARQAAHSGNYDGVIAIGCVIQGRDSAFRIHQQSVSLGIGQVALETGIPVTFGVLTVNTDEQAMARSDENKENKGFEAATASGRNGQFVASNLMGTRRKAREFALQMLFQWDITHDDDCGKSRRRSGRIIREPPAVMEFAKGLAVGAS